jgi:hypothetical protein
MFFLSMKRYTPLHIAALILLQCFWDGCLRAQEPTKADGITEYYRSSSSPLPWPDRSQRGILLPAPNSQIHNQQAAAPAQEAAAVSYPAYIVDIVNACQSDPKKLFDFVRNNIRFTPYFGFRKGTEATWLTKAGNDADQAQLLVTLLRAAGFASARYEYGIVDMASAVGRAWFGSDNDDRLAAIHGSSGYWGSLENGTFTTEQIWVTVDIEGITYGLAPAYKTYTKVQGIADLGAEMHYSRLALMDAAGGTATADFAQNVSEENISGYLTERATDLVSAIRTAKPNAELDEIVSGRRLVRQEVAALTDAFPAAMSVQWSYSFSETDVDYYYVSEWLSVVVRTADGTELATFSDVSQNIGAQRLSVTFDPGDSHAQIWRDDVSVAEELLPIANSAIETRVTVFHPYLELNVNEWRSVNLKRSGTYAVLVHPEVYDSEELKARGRSKVAEYQRQGLLPNSRQIVTEGLYQLGMEYLSETNATRTLMGRITNSESIIHHFFGFVIQEDGFGVDMAGRTSMVPRDGEDDKRAPIHRALLTVGSALEHGVIEQRSGRRGVSSVRYAVQNNRNSDPSNGFHKTYYATPENYGSIHDDLVAGGWSWIYTDYLFPDWLEYGSRLIIPYDGNQQVDDTNGDGFFIIGESSVSGIIDVNYNTLKGGLGNDGRTD